MDDRKIELKIPFYDVEFYMDPRKTEREFNLRVSDSVGGREIEARVKLEFLVYAEPEPIVIVRILTGQGRSYVFRKIPYQLDGADFGNEGGNTNKDALMDRFELEYRNSVDKDQKIMIMDGLYVSGEPDEVCNFIEFLLGDLYRSNPDNMEWQPAILPSVLEPEPETSEKPKNPKKPKKPRKPRKSRFCGSRPNAVYPGGGGLLKNKKYSNKRRKRIKKRTKKRSKKRSKKNK